MSNDEPTKIEPMPLMYFGPDHYRVLVDKYVVLSEKYADLADRHSELLLNIAREKYND